MSHSQIQAMLALQRAHSGSGETGCFLVNQPKSQLTATQTLDWLAISWNSVNTLADSHNRILSKVFRIRCSQNFTRRIWGSLLGSLNFAADMVPFSRICHRHLSWKGNIAVPITDRDKLHPSGFHLLEIGCLVPQTLLVSSQKLDSTASSAHHHY